MPWSMGEGLGLPNSRDVDRPKHGRMTPDFDRDYSAPRLSFRLVIHAEMVPMDQVRTVRDLSAWADRFVRRTS